MLDLTLHRCYAVVMASVEPLEELLREHPSDWPSWLVYGDWLLAQGDDRGNLVRLAYERSRAGVRASRDLDERIKALTHKQRAAFSVSLPQSAKITWRNGFAVGLSLPLENGTAALVQALLPNRDARFLSSLTLYAEAKDNPDRDDEEPEEMEEMEERTAPEPIHAEAAQAVLALDLRAIRELSFAYAVIGPEAARALADAKTLGPLSALDLRYCYIGDRGAQSLAASPNVTKLERLFLQRNAIKLKGLRAIAESPHLGSLRQLDLRYNKLGSKGAESLALSSNLARIEQLRLYRTDIGGKAGARALANSAHLSVSLKRFWRAQ